MKVSCYAGQQLRATVSQSHTVSQGKAKNLQSCVTMTLSTTPAHFCSTHSPMTRGTLCVIYLEKRISTLQSGWAQGSKRAESTPEVDTGEQGARSQQDGCLQYTRRLLKDLPGLLCHSKDTNRIHIICPSPPQTSLSPKFYHNEKLRNPFIT